MAEHLMTRGGVEVVSPNCRNCGAPTGKGQVSLSGTVTFFCLAGCGGSETVKPTEQDTSAAPPG